MKRRGYIFFDTLMGLLLIGAAAGLMVVATSRVQRAMQRLEDVRHADRLAHEAMLSMQVDPNPQPIEGAEITLEPIPNLKAPSGWQWVVIHCKTDRAKTELTGLIRGAS